MRAVVRLLTAVFLTVAALVLVVQQVRASVGNLQESQQQSSGTNGAASHSLTISIHAVSPRIATPTSNVEVSGTVSNHTGSAIPYIVLQAQTSPQWFEDRSGMTAFASGLPYPGLQPAGLPYALTAPLASGATAHWKLSFPAEVFYSDKSVGVYPLQVQASSAASAYQAAASTFLPFWPGAGGATPLQTAWIWPLIAVPQQGACPQTLETNSLASAISGSGRLSVLLSAGSQWAQRDHLTWAIDPALLSDVSVMTHPYSVGGDAACSGRVPVRKPGGAAADWLDKLRTAAAGEPAFLTPYADVDVAALSHAGLQADVRTAYRIGDAVARRILPGTFGKNGNGSADGAALAAAWPANGVADRGVVNTLVAGGGIKTVVLNSGQLPASSPYDNALARTISRGTSVSVLLADSGISSLLGSATAGSSAAARFAFTQDFLAQTAMISAEAPSLPRGLVIAPPRNWDPTPAEAAELLSLTSRAPWLRPTRLSTLAAEAGSAKAKPLPARRVSSAELPRYYLGQVHSLDVNVRLLTNLLYRPPQSFVSSLDAAVAVTESTAWRGGGSPGGWLAATKLSYYLSNNEHEVRIITGKKVLMAGTSGTTAVSVQNGLDMPVEVRVTASTPAGGQLTVGADSLHVVAAKGTYTTRISMRSATIGTTTMRLQLVTRDGSPLTWTAEPLSVEVTRFGRTLLVIVGAALGVFVLATAWRLRRKRKAPGEHADSAGERVEAGGAG